MEMGALVSVIVPVFNVAAYLVEALDSVIHQTYENLEIIIIDDGSTDGAGEICEAYAGRDGRIRLIHQENKGLSSARNVGLNAMTGEAVAFLDPDDAYDPFFIERSVSAMVREGADLVIGRYQICHTTGRLQYKSGERSFPTIRSGTYDRAGAIGALIDGTCNASVWNKLYSRELFWEIRFLEGHVYEDIEIAYRINSRCEKLVVLDNLLYLHRKRPGSITTTLSLENIKDQLMALSRAGSVIRANVPDMVPEAMEEKFKQKQIKQMIICYVRMAHINDENKCKAEETLRKQIIAMGQEIGMTDGSLRIRTAYWMICKFPRLLQIIYPVYRPARLLVRKILGR